MSKCLLAATVAGWADGDFNNDGWVNDIDATIMAVNWGQTVFTTTAVPEPGTITLLLCGLASLICRRVTVR